MNVQASRIAALQIQGGRQYQEDAFGQADPLDGRDGDCLLVVADGMGGHAGGDVASRLVADTFVEYYPGSEGLPAERLRQCLDAADEAIIAATAENRALGGMGATVVAAAVLQQELHWVSVGDSPMWLFRQGALRRLNEDHSMGAELQKQVAAGEMTEEEAANDYRQNILLSVVMGEGFPMVDLPADPMALEAGDRLLLASDGLLTLRERAIAELLRQMAGDPPKVAAEALIQAVEEAERPHQDNVTVLLYEHAA